MIEPVVLRPRFGQVLCVVVWAIIVVCLVSLATVRDGGGSLRFAPAFLLAAYLCWMLYWAPAVKLDSAGVSLVNIARTVRITWPAIATVETKYALTIRTASGKYTAWAAPGPSRFTTFRATRSDLSKLPESTYGAGGSVGIGDVPNSDSGAAALRVRRAWAQLQAAGHLDSGAVEGTGVEVTWHRWRLIVLAALVLLTLAGILI
ncbi:PH domain-containing protein [Rathayibacter sp. CAU 1779]